MNRLLLLAAAVLLASCSGPRRDRQPVEEFVQVRDRQDLDSFSGQNVSVEGKFGHVGARHGTVTLDSGLILYVPHFDLFKKGDDWLKYVGHPVRVEGILHTETSGTPGIEGPAIDIKRFETLDASE